MNCMLKIVTSVVTLIALLGTVLPAQPAGAEEQSTKAPWEWSAEERAAARAEYERLQVANHLDREGPSGRSVSIELEGGENPELLMPWEIFLSLSNRAFSPDPESRAVYRELFAASPKMLTVDDDFWAMLESVFGEYLASIRQQKNLAEGLVGGSDEERELLLAEISVLQVDDCQKRADALQAARAVYGREAFDHFLYTGPATQMKIFLMVDDDPIQRMEKLLFVGRGCRNTVEVRDTER